ncbi:MAG: single-stranded-DNA-specific exonuclease RecJ [Thermodesulfobacteriota bacterium]
MKKQWEILQPEPRVQQTIRRLTGCSPTIAALLANRKVDQPDRIRQFWSPSFQDLRPPFSIRDMDKAVALIVQTIESKNKIMVFGDYDVDGVTATVILYEFLRSTGADVCYYIPHRLTEGYGLRSSHITGKAELENIRLIITVDCGSADHDAVNAANEAGIQIVVTDHHQITTDIPAAEAVINPKREDCGAGLAHLAGVGVAFYLIIALRKQLRDRQHWKTVPEPNLKALCDLVCLGTIADMVPLIDENRIFSKIGLEIITGNSRPGLKALMEVCRIGAPAVDSEDVAYRLAPRLNAAGRMGHADLAAKLLITTDPDEARELTRRLCSLNDIRQATEQEIMKAVHSYLQDNPNLLKKHSIVLHHHGWHAGVLGIVAAKLVEKYGRPAMLISTAGGIGKGSGRSIPGFDIHAALKSCEAHLLAFGGHQMAAGLTIRPESIEAFQEQFDQQAALGTGPGGLPPKMWIDCVLDFHLITDNLLDELTALEPFGVQNPEPLFLARNIRIQSVAEVGGSHKRLRLAQNNGRHQQLHDAILFNAGNRDCSAEKSHEVAYRLRWNHWNGKKKAQMIIEDMRPMEPVGQASLPAPPMQ